MTTFQQKITEIIKDKKDKTGNPYFFHLITVRNTLTEKMGRYSYKHCVSAMIYDLIQTDEEWTVEKIKFTFKDALEDVVKYYCDEKVTDKIINIVGCLIKKTNETHDEYMQRVIKFGNDAIIIKLCDLEHKMKSIKKLDNSEEEIECLKMYRKAHNKLSSIIARW